MKIYKHVHFKKRADFREWLKANHNKSDGIWMIFFKKHTKKENITYPEALDEALCFGWIDSTKKGIDEEKYIWKFTPRTNVKNWSDVNKLKVRKLIDSGLMTEAGLNKIDLYLKTGKVDWKVEPKQKNPKPTLVVPDYIKQYFSANEPAMLNFKKLALSHQRNYIGWITSAKKQETINKRLEEATSLLKQNKKLGIK
jgi:uncharacterized protein YdeI (YjbR/CyaY-like superfamily)